MPLATLCPHESSFRVLPPARHRTGRAPPASGQSGQMSHREVMEALSGLLLAMFVAMLSSTIVSNALPRHRDRPRRQPDRLHLGRRGHAAHHDGDHADLGQARRPVLQEGPGPERPGHLLRRLGDRRLRAHDGGAHRRPRHPGPRRRRAHRAGAGRDRDHGPAARARSLLRLHRRRLRARHRQRPPRRWPARGHGRSGAGASSSASRSPCSPSSCSRRRCACPVVKREVHIDYLGATLLVGGVSLLLVWVSLAGNQFAWTSTTSIALAARRPGRRRRGRLRRGEGRQGPDHPAATLPRPHHVAGHRCLGAHRGGDVRCHRLPLAVLPARPRHVARPAPASCRSPWSAGCSSPASSPVGSSRATGRWKKFLIGGMVLVIAGPAAALDHRRHHQPVGRRRLHGGPRARPRRHDAEPRARGAEQHRRRPTWARPARSSRSSARWAARSASRHWVRCSATRSPTRSPAASRSWASQGGDGDARRRIPDLATLPAPVRQVFEHAFGEATGHIFLVALPFAVALAAPVLFIEEKPMRETPARRRAPRGRPRRPGRRRCWSGERPDPDPDALEQEMGILMRRVRRALSERARARAPVAAARGVPDARPPHRGGAAALGGHRRGVRPRQGRGAAPGAAPRRARPGRAQDATPTTAAPRWSRPPTEAKDRVDQVSRLRIEPLDAPARGLDRRGPGRARRHPRPLQRDARS